MSTEELKELLADVDVEATETTFVIWLWHFQFGYFMDKVSEWLETIEYGSGHPMQVHQGGLISLDIMPVIEFYEIDIDEIRDFLI